MPGWYTASDLITFMENNGLATKAPANAADYMAAAADWIEAETGWFPFPSTEAPYARFFTPPNKSKRGFILELNSGIADYDANANASASLVVTVNWDYANARGNVLTLHKDFELYPDERGNRWPPYEICFITGVYGPPKSIKIVNDWGFTTPDAMPYSILDAQLRKAAAEALIDTEGVEGQLKRVRQGPVSYEYESENESTPGRLLREAFNGIKQYRRIT